MRAVGIVLAGGNNYKMGELSKKRAIAAMPVAGSYKCIDFALSNMSNSRVQRVAVCTQYNARSLNQHLNSSKWWDFGRKQGGLSVLTPYITADNSSWYRGTADAIYQNIDFLKESHEPYVIISSGDCIYKTDFGRMLEYHIEKQADITVAYTALQPGADDPTRFGVLKLEDDGRITGFEEKPLETTCNIVSTGIYIIRRRLLIALIEQSAQENRYDFVSDILVRYRMAKKIYGYKLEGYWRNISTVESYFKANKDFLKREVRDFFFKGYTGIYSKIEDQPPAKFNTGASVSNSLVASGCIVNGDINSSVLFAKVYVGNNCMIKNSIILNDVYIGDNTVIENCIIESGSTIHPDTSYIGEQNNIRIVKEDNERFII